jgi:hypothetical protein
MLIKNREWNVKRETLTLKNADLSHYNLRNRKQLEVSLISIATVPSMLLLFGFKQQNHHFRLLIFWIVRASFLFFFFNALHLFLRSSCSIASPHILRTRYRRDFCLNTHLILSDLDGHIKFYISINLNLFFFTTLLSLKNNPRSNFFSIAIAIL